MSSLNPTQTAPSAKDWPVGVKAAWFTCIIASLLNMFDMIDRMVVASLLPYLKAEWGLSDTQLGGLISIVNISISVLVVPVSIIVDKWSKKKMIGIMAIIWSVATAACAFAGTYSHLFVARFFVGAGEAGYMPAAQSLLGTIFPKWWRTRVISFVVAGGSFGVPAGLMLGAFIATHYGWRHAFGIVAVPGLVAALLAFFIREPRRKTQGTKSTEAPALQPSFIRLLPRLFGTPSLAGVYLGTTLCLIYTGTVMGWFPSYFSRVAGLPITRASGLTSLIMIAGIFFMMLFSCFIDRLRRKHATATAAALAVAALTGAGCMFAGFALMSPGGMPQIILLLAGNCALSTLSPMASATILDIAPEAARATAISLLIMCQNVLGMGLGPLLAGAVSDRWGLSFAMTVLAVAPLLAVTPYLVTMFRYRRDMAPVSNETLSSPAL